MGGLIRRSLQSIQDTYLIALTHTHTHTLIKGSGLSHQRLRLLRLLLLRLSFLPSCRRCRISAPEYLLCIDQAVGKQLPDRQYGSLEGRMVAAGSPKAQLHLERAGGGRGGGVKGGVGGGRGEGVGPPTRSHYTRRFGIVCNLFFFFLLFFHVYLLCYRDGGENPAG